MLTARDRYSVLTSFRHVCNFNQFPMEVTPHIWDVRPGRDKKWKLWACKVSYALFVAHASYKFFRLLNIFFFLHGVPLHQVIIHGVLAADGITFVFWHYSLYYTNADLNAVYVRMTLAGNISGGNVIRDYSNVMSSYIQTFFAQDRLLP